MKRNQFAVTLAVLAGTCTWSIAFNVAPVSAVTGTCVSVGVFTSSGTCTVLAGETVDFVVKGGNGGNGGNSGRGGNGGVGWNGSFSVPGGFGGTGAQGGLGGPGAKVGGSYFNSSGTTITLTVVRGSNGAAGAHGADGSSGSGATQSGAASSGANGNNGGNGANGANGTASSISDGSGVVVSAAGGTGGAGAVRGLGGQGGQASGANGMNGSNGSAGMQGNSGQNASTPSPLPTNWTFLATNASETPSLTFTGLGISDPSPGGGGSSGGGSSGGGTSGGGGTGTQTTFVPLAPKRIMDTRSGSKVGALDGTGQAHTLNVLSQGGLPGSGINAVALNVTVVNGEAGDVGGYVTVYPCASGNTGSSNLNFVAGQTIPNSVIAPVDPQGNVCFYVYGKAHLLADVSGYFPTTPV